MFLIYFFLYNQGYNLPQSYEGRQGKGNFYSKNDLNKS